LKKQVIAYVAFVVFCFLSAARDVLSEVFFKGQTNGNNPVFVLFVYVFITQVIAGAICVVNRARWVAAYVAILNSKKELIFLNIFTLTAYLFYFLAIKSPLGAALNTFVDYGFSPVLTALVGVHLAGERLGRGFGWAALTAGAGLLIMVIPRFHVEHISSLWFVGAGLALLSSLSTSYCRVYFKILLEKGLDKSSIIFLRLIGPTVILGLFLLVMPELIHLDHIAETVIVGIFGFTIPLFLILNVVQRVNIGGLSMLLFLFPALTLMFSWFLGYAHLFISDVGAGAVILLGVAMYQALERISVEVRKASN
jgi:drug/metabolite transporter (DMT)-like permease